MSTIEQNLQKLVDAKESIRTAIQNKKVAVPETASISTYSTYIDQIELKELQTKTYNITENGTIIISPDEGFDGISGGVIEVKVSPKFAKVCVDIVPNDIPAQVTISYADEVETITNETGTITFDVYSGIEYELSFSDIEGYSTPPSLFGHVDYQQTNTHTASYEGSNEVICEYTVTATSKTVQMIAKNTDKFILSYSLDGGDYQPVTSTTYLDVRLNNGVHVVKYNYSSDTPPAGLFENCPDLTKVVIPKSWARLSQRCFSGTGLRTITIPSNIKQYTRLDNIFRACENLHTVILESGCVLNGWYMFAECKALESVTINKDVTLSGENIFMKCSSLQNVEIHEGATFENTAYMFDGCSGLTTITIPDGITLYNGMFSLCTSLSTINGSFDKIDSISSSFGTCYRITSMDLGNAVAITQPVNAYGAFQSCSGLTSVVLPNTTFTDTDRLFRNCTSLRSITVKSPVAPSIGDYMFDNIPSTGTLYYPSGSDYSTWLAAMPSGWTGVPV